MLPTYDPWSPEEVDLTFPVMLDSAGRAREGLKQQRAQCLHAVAMCDRVPGLTSQAYAHYVVA